MWNYLRESLVIILFRKGLCHCQCHADWEVTRPFCLRIIWKSICFQMLSLGHSIRNGSAGNVLTKNYAVKKECSCILSIKWLCNSNRSYIKKWATKHVKQVWSLRIELTQLLHLQFWCTSGMWWAFLIVTQFKLLNSLLNYIFIWNWSGLFFCLGLMLLSHGASILTDVFSKWFHMWYWGPSVLWEQLS